MGCEKKALSAAEIDEVQLIKPFISEAKRERYCGFVSSSKKRAKFLQELYHFSDFDSDVIVRMPGKDETFTLQRVFACVEGTIICCGPKIAYYEGEAPRNRYILHKQKV